MKLLNNLEYFDIETTFINFCIHQFTDKKIIQFFKASGCKLFILATFKKKVLKLVNYFFFI